MSSPSERGPPNAVVAVSPGDDPFRHLAMEAALMRHAAETGASCLFFYCNRLSVVWGKHQNPWLECDLARASAEGAETVRRFSGGGAVAHDPGNLNFAIAVPRERHQPDRNMDRVIAALRGLGIPAERHLRVGLAAGGLKFSGQAFSLRGPSALHHGTLLVSSDLDRIRRLLAPADSDARTHAIRSIPSPIRNLSELRPGIGMDEIRVALIREFREAWGKPALETWDEDRWAGLDLRADEARYRSWEWRYGETPDFEWNWTEARARFTAEVREGMVRHVRSDAGDASPSALRVGDRFTPVGASID